MVNRADCRECIYFDPQRKRDGTLGWCRKRGAPVTHYVGSCRYFKRVKDLRQVPITRFLQENDDLSI